MITIPLFVLHNLEECLTKCNCSCASILNIYVKNAIGLNHLGECWPQNMHQNCKYLFLIVESRYPDLDLGRLRNWSESSWQVFALKYCTETLQIAFSHNRALSGTFRLLHRARQYELPIISYLVDNETLPNASFLYRIFLPWSQRNSVWYILTEANDIAYNYGCLHADHLLPCLHACLLQNQVVFAPKDWNPANWFFSPQNFSD